MSSPREREARGDPAPLALSSGAQYATDTADRSISPSSFDFNTMPSQSDSYTNSIVTRLQIQSTSLPKAWISPICGAELDWLQAW